MSSLTMLEKSTLEKLFGMQTGYVLDLNSQQFAHLFKSTCNIDIDNPPYNIGGNSKAKKLRIFWTEEPDIKVGKVLKQILECCAKTETNSEELVKGRDIVSRLLGERINSDDSFLKTQFEEVYFSVAHVDMEVIPLLKVRWEEAVKCRDAGAYLAVIFMCGSILEGLLLGVAMRKPKEFNQATISPKNAETVKEFKDWKLGELIDVAHELKLVSLDIKKFGHVLRDFRNYIHPHCQMNSKFNPDKHTADICLQVLRAAIASLNCLREKARV